MASVLVVVVGSTSSAPRAVQRNTTRHGSLKRIEWKPARSPRSARGDSPVGPGGRAGHGRLRGSRACEGQWRDVGRESPPSAPPATVVEHRGVGVAEGNDHRRILGLAWKPCKRACEPIPDAPRAPGRLFSAVGDVMVPEAAFVPRGGPPARRRAPSARGKRRNGRAIWTAIALVERVGAREWVA